MANIQDLYAALAGDATEVQAVTDAQTAVDAATAAKATADTAVVDAQAALDAVVVVDAQNPTPEEQTALDAAQATLDTATSTAATAATALTDAQTALTTAQGNVDAGDAVAIADDLSVTDFGMVSNDMARAILSARGEEVMFEEPEVVNSDYNMNLID